MWLEDSDSDSDSDREIERQRWLNERIYRCLWEVCATFSSGPNESNRCFLMRFLFRCTESSCQCDISNNNLKFEFRALSRFKSNEKITKKYLDWSLNDPDCSVHAQYFYIFERSKSFFTPLYDKTTIFI